MADKIINDLTAVSAVAAADEFEVQKSGETTTKKATLTQVTAVEAAARELADAAIRYWTGVNADGSWPAFVNSWYLRNADYVAGLVDRAGASGALSPYGIYNALRILDAKIYSSLEGGDESTHHATFRSPAGATGVFHCFGYYEAPVAHKAFSNAAATQTLGSANNSYGANVFIVAKELGTASGGTTGTAKITITGTSITSAGVRAAGDSEILVADVKLLTANQYVQSVKSWIGQVTLTIAATGNHTVFTATCNYGLATASLFNGKNVLIDTFNATGRAGANDSGFDIQLLKHDGTGWVYSAAAFQPGGTVVCSLATDYVTEKNLVSGIRWRYKRSGLALEIDGALGQGVIVRITTSANNAIESSDFRLYYTYL